MDILEFLKNNKDCFKIILLYGNVGVGKSTLISRLTECLELTSYTIVFREDDFSPFETLIKTGTPASEEESIIIALSELISCNEVLIFSNMEYCGIDYLRLLMRIFRYHKNNCRQCVIILEYNSIEKPINLLVDLADRVIQVPSTEEKIFQTYLVDHFVDAVSNSSLFERIVSLADGNINNFFMVLNILNHGGIITMQEDKFYYQGINEDLPLTLLQLFGWIFDRLDQSEQEPLYITAPIFPEIYIKILESIVENFTQYEKQLDSLSERNLFIKKHIMACYSTESIFAESYRCTTQYAKNAICQKISENEIKAFIKRYYAYLERTYENNSENNCLAELDRARLAMLLVKNCQGGLKIAHIPLVVFIMKYHYRHFRYFDTIEYAKKVINSEILNFRQLNEVYPDFYRIYFKSLLAVGDYDEIINFEKSITRDDLVYLVALAYYNKGLVYQSKRVLKDSWRNDNTQNPGYCNALLASLYDWLGDSKRSRIYFKKALSQCHNDSELKNQLFKRYSMFIDFRLQQCKTNMLSATDYYKDKNLKQYAECLHNCGTGYLTTKQYTEARKLLVKCEEILKKICDEELYYPINSMAILLSYEKKDFENAIVLLKLALQSNISVDFCWLALQNNLLNLYIQQQDWSMVKSMISFLENEFIRLCQIPNLASDLKKVRPDIQHQLRHFYFNCAVYYKLNGNGQSALVYFQNAKKCSNYSSVLEFAIQQNILDIAKELGQHILFPAYIKYKIVKPTPLEREIYERNMYLCNIMFWG